MRRLSTHVLLAALTLANADHVFAQADFRPDEGKQPLKARRQFTRPRDDHEGVIDKLDRDSMTIRWTDPKTDKERTLEVFALDIHKEGKHQEYATGAFSYLWSDLKKGDSVWLQTLKDTDGRVYCTEICIRRRPGDRLPVSQLPKLDARYRKDVILNDIDNGLDVSEADIGTAFPAWVSPNTGEQLLPGGLPGGYRGKLNTLRDKLDAEKEKKEKELRANPPPKKDDKK